jgi:hypothetical protein
LYGDSEFRAVDLQKYCRNQGWHWYLGLKWLSAALEHDSLKPLAFGGATQI